MLEKRSEAMIPTKWGKMNMATYSTSQDDQMPIVMMYNPNTNFEKTVNVRMHSECMTGDLFGSRRCDCGEQLDFAMQYIAKNEGIVLYLRQEGRGIGIINKLRAYNKQDEGLNTLEANLVLGFHADDRNYDQAIEVLKLLRIKSINLLTNNPEKLDSFHSTGIMVEKRIPVIIEPHEDNISYLSTKKEDFGHLL